MRILAIAAGALFATLATGASAQYHGRYGYVPPVGYECWNPHAGHYESVRPGPPQGDLDFSRCRPPEGYEYRNHGYDERAYSPRYPQAYGWQGQAVPPVGYECWNSNAGHYESVRPGPPQGDLDFSRCRPPEGYRWR